MTNRGYTFSKVLQFTEQADIDWDLQAWLDLVKSANLPEMNSLLHTFTYWKDEIIAALRYSYSNGFTERCNNKIKVLKRFLRSTQLHELSHKDFVYKCKNRHTPYLMYIRPARALKR